MVLIEFYVRFDMKLKNINTLAPCLSALYVTMGSDGKNVIYLSALDKNEEDFILAADKNSHLADMQKEVNDKLQEAINADEAFRQLYQTMDQAIANVSSTPEPQADAHSQRPNQPLLTQMLLQPQIRTLLRLPTQMPLQPQIRTLLRLPIQMPLRLQIRMLLRLPIRMLLRLNNLLI